MLKKKKTKRKPRLHIGSTHLFEIDTILYHGLRSNSGTVANTKRTMHDMSKIVFKIWLLYIDISLYRIADYIHVHCARRLQGRAVANSLFDHNQIVSFA